LNLCPLFDFTSICLCYCFFISLLVPSLLFLCTW
jgi:hypothetical protein